jgi:signal transduction histidine kinase
MRELARRTWGSVRVRTTIVAAAVFALAFGLAGWALVEIVQTRLEEQVRDETIRLAAVTDAQLAAGIAPDAVRYPIGGTGAVKILSVEGTLLGGERFDFTLPLGAGAGGTASASDTVLSPDGNLMIARRLSSFDGEPVQIIAASPLADVQRSVDAVGNVLVFVTPLLVAGVGVLVWVLVGRALQPVAAITREVEEITHTTMHRRVPEPSSRDEIHVLARTMNDMLQRLESANDKQRAFVSDASHELRTPITTVQTVLEVGLRSGHVEPAARRALEANNRLGEVVADLLDLARVDEADEGNESFRSVDVEEVVLALVRDTDDVRIDVSGVLAGRVRGDRASLGRLVRNFVENARRHARDRIAVALWSVGDSVVLVVEDDGPGVPPDQRDRVFERFVRLDDSRDRAEGGSGLGLAIVRAVAVQHGGRVAVSESRFGGARFQVVLPVSTGA